MQQKILLVEDSFESQRSVQELLKYKYEVETVSSLAEAREHLKREHYSLVLLDIMLPDGQGYDLCRDLQGDLGEEGGIPVIFLSGKTSIADKFLGFSVGAEDYVTKPFDPAELMVRVDHMILRNEKRKQHGEVIVRGPLKIDLGSYAVSMKNETGESRVDLTPVEFKLLLKLAQNQNRVLSREQLIDGVWGNSVFIEDRSVDKHITPTVA